MKIRTKLIFGLLTLCCSAALLVAMTGCASHDRITPLPLPGSASSVYEPVPNERAIGQSLHQRLDGRPQNRARPDYTYSSDEVWIISRTSEHPPVDADSDDPGTGELVIQRKDRFVPLPLKHTDVRAAVSGYIGTVTVKQQFANPYDTKIEAIYVFPLPHNAAINEFVMTIGERRIRGIIRERKEAEKIYRQARDQGYVASLLTEERPNIFRQSVANIEPGHPIDVDIKYFQTLSYVDGWFEFVFPMVVGPRYNPAGKTDGVGAVSRDHTYGSGQRTEVAYLKPRERSGHDIALQLDVDAGVDIEDFSCSSHHITRRQTDPRHLSVALAASDTIPNKDFILRYRVAGERTKSNVLVHRDDLGGYFTMMIYPPNDLKHLHRMPLELVFLLDCSGSMSGQPIAQAKAAIRHALEQLQPGDSFQIINFSERASRLGKKPLEATPENIRQGLRYVASLDGDGPTEMIEGIKAALDFPHDPERLRFVCFLTDGFIGNERDILAAVHDRLGASRIFSFGVGSAPNRYLLDGLARLGRGAAAYLGLKDDGAAVMDDFFERISHPALSHIEIDWGASTVEDVFPQHVPDLFVGRPVIVTGRITRTFPSRVRVTGKVGRERVAMEIPVSPAAANSGAEALPSVWARMKIADMAEKMTYSSRNFEGAIRQVALDYGLMSAYTAFIAVDSSHRTGGDEGVTVPVPVPVPEGVHYDTTVR